MPQAELRPALRALLAQGVHPAGHVLRHVQSRVRRFLPGEIHMEPKKAPHKQLPLKTIWNVGVFGPTCSTWGVVGSGPPSNSLEKGVPLQIHMEANKGEL